MIEATRILELQRPGVAQTPASAVLNRTSELTEMPAFEQAPEGQRPSGRKGSPEPEEHGRDLAKDRRVLTNFHIGKNSFHSVIVLWYHLCFY